MVTCQQIRRPSSPSGREEGRGAGVRGRRRETGFDAGRSLMRSLGTGPSLEALAAANVQRPGPDMVFATEIVRPYPRYQRLVGCGSVEGEDFVQLGDGE